MEKKSFTRRDFLRVAAMTPMAGAVAYGMNVPTAEGAVKTSKVVLVRDEKALSGPKKSDPEVIQKMLDDGINALYGESDPVKAWKRIIKPNDVVGIKSNYWKFLSTTPEVEQAIKQRVMDAGVPETNLSIDDKGVRSNPIFQNATALINTRPVKIHFYAGIGSCIKNYIIFDDNRRSYHDDSCAKLGEIWHKYDLKNKTRLNVLIMLNPPFHGIGPRGYSDEYIWDYKGLLISEDPVAAYTTALRIMQAKRLEFFGEEKPIAPSPKHIQVADTEYNLGVSDPNRIEVVKLGWEDGILI